MTLTSEHLISTLPQFANSVAKLLNDLGISASDLFADHIALRVNGVETANTLFPQWLQRGKQISNAVINGRPIWIVKLDNDLTVGPWQVDCVELPFPSDKRYPQEGWEHIEFVVPGEATTIAALEVAMKKNFPHSKLSVDELSELGIAYKASEPHAEGEQLPNPTLAFKRDGVCVKFHSYAIEEVVASERNNLNG